MLYYKLLESVCVNRRWADQRRAVPGHVLPEVEALRRYRQSLE